MGSRKKFNVNEIGEKKKNSQDIIRDGMKPDSFKNGNIVNNPIYFPKKKK